MKKQVLTMLLAVWTLPILCKLSAQNGGPVFGQVMFENATVDAPVFGPDGIPLDNDEESEEFVAALWAGPADAEETDLVQETNPVEFFGRDYAGIFFQGAVALDDAAILAGEEATLQVRAWNRTQGTFGVATLKGKSEMLKVVTGGNGQPPALPSPLHSLHSFALQPDSEGGSDYDRWVESVFGPNADAELTSPNADFNGDGTSNFAEYAFGLDPTDPTDRDTITARVESDKQNEENFLAAEFQARGESANLSYSVRLSQTLQQWTIIPLSFDGSTWQAEEPGVEVLSAELSASGLWTLTLRPSSSISDETASGGAMSFLSIRAETNP